MPSKWVIRLAIVGAIGLLIATVLRLLTPATPDIPLSELVTTNTDGSQTTFSNVTYTGQDLAVPARLGIAAYTAQEVPVVDKLLQDFQLKSGSTTFKVWRGPEYTLTYSSQIEQYSLSLNQANKAGERGIQPEAAQTVASNFVQEYFADPNLTLIDSQVAYSQDEGRDDVSPAEADFGYFPFSYVLDGYPVVLGQNNLLPVGISVASNNKISVVVFTPALLSINPVGQKPTISVDTAVQNINAGQASITSAFQADLQPIDLSTVSAGNLTAVTLQYRLDPTNKLIYPFYIFSGSVTTQQNIPLEVEISTPAVAIN